MQKNSTKDNLIVRQIGTNDIDSIKMLDGQAYDFGAPISNFQIESLISVYPAGQIAIEVSGEIVGYSFCIKRDENSIFSGHDWNSISGIGSGSTHENDGDWLYGIEMVVSKKYRRSGVASDMYEARKELCVAESLKGVACGARMPSFFSAPEDMPVGKYIEMVFDGKLTDPVISTLVKNSFLGLGALNSYLPEDYHSKGFAVLMIWENTLGSSQKRR